MVQGKGLVDVRTHADRDVAQLSGLAVEPPGQLLAKK